MHGGALQDEAPTLRWGDYRADFWLVLCTVTAGLEKVLSPNVQVGFVSDAQKFANAVATGQILALAKSLGR